MATGDIIQALDYNAIRDKVASVLGAGYYQRGYGQALNSSEASIGHTITEAVWNELRLDLVNILLHQTGVQPNIPVPITGQVIRFGEDHQVPGYDSIIDDAIVSRFNIGANRQVITAKETETYSSSWTNQASCVASVTFDTADKARWFFNSGGKIRFYSSLVTSTSTAQNTMWQNLLDNAGLVQFGASTPTGVTYYNLTDNHQLVASFSPEDGGTSKWEITARCNVPNNSNGTATQIDFNVLWKNGSGSGLYDLYGLYGGTVSGTLSLFMDELKATGPMFPSGTFTIASPIYSIAPIVGS